MKIDNLKINNKEITIYKNNELNNENTPLVILNTFDESQEDIWNKCKELDTNNFIFACISNINWDKEMYIWKVPKIKESNDGANKYTNELINTIIPKIQEKLEIKSKKIYLVGYSMAGLFSLYSLYKTNIFTGIASVSGSLWYPNLIDFVENNNLKIIPNKMYFSLGNKESKTKNKLYSKVEENTIYLEHFYRKNGINAIYEENEGNHFQNVSLRIAKAIRWLIN